MLGKCTDVSLGMGEDLWMTGPEFVFSTTQRRVPCPMPKFLSVEGLPRGQGWLTHVTHSGLWLHSYCSIAKPASPKCLFLSPICLSLALLAVSATITTLIWDVGSLSVFRLKPHYQASLPKERTDIQYITGDISITWDQAATCIFSHYTCDGGL